MDFFMRTRIQVIFIEFSEVDMFEGNLFVRIKKGTKHDPELVILDHGLCEELPTDLRLNYCNFWKYVILKDWKKIEYYARYTSLYFA
jgi:aarF domain-containing kinase